MNQKLLYALGIAIAVIVVFYFYTVPYSLR